MGIEGLSAHPAIETDDIAVPGVSWGAKTGPFSLQPGRLVELVGDPGSGLTRLGFRLLAPFSRSHTVVVVDSRGWISPEAAWEAGVLVERLVLVRCESHLLWPKVTAALMEGVQAMYLEVPPRVRDRDLRRLAAMARARRVAVVARSMGGHLPAGVPFTRLRVLGVTWEGADRGHGKLTRRRLVIEASGKGASGVTRRFEVEDEGTDSLRVVSDVVVGQTGRSFV